MKSFFFLVLFASLYFVNFAQITKNIPNPFIPEDDMTMGPEKSAANPENTTLTTTNTNSSQIDQNITGIDSNGTHQSPQYPIGNSTISNNSTESQLNSTNATRSTGKCKIITVLYKLINHLGEEKLIISAGLMLGMLLITN